MHRNETIFSHDGISVCLFVCAVWMCVCVAVCVTEKWKMVKEKMQNERKETTWQMFCGLLHRRKTEKETGGGERREVRGVINCSFRSSEWKAKMIMHLCFKRRRLKKSREQRVSMRIILFSNCRREGWWKRREKKQQVCAILDSPVRVKLRKELQLSQGHRRQVSFSVFQSHCCCLHAYVALR